MSAPSGIKVPDDLVSAFASAQSNAENTRALVLTIDGEAFKLVTTVAPQGSYTDDVALLPPTLPSKQTPASFAYRLDSKSGGSYEWMMITFVPDDAGVRAKMLQASSRAGLLKSLGASNFKHDWFATSLNDLAPGAFKSHLNHILSPPPLTASEKALAEIKAAEADEAKRVALDAETAAARKQAVIGLGGKTQWQEGVAEALLKASQRSDDGWLVTLEIAQNNTAAIQLLRSEACKPGELAGKLPDKSPCYAFYSFPTPPPPKPVKPATPVQSSPAVARNTFQATAGGARNVEVSNAPRYDEDTKDDQKEDKQEGNEEQETGLNEDAENGDSEQAAPPARDPTPPPASPSPPPPEIKGRVLFIYWCPSGSPVRFRMVYSTTVRGIQQDAIDKAGIEIVAKMETSDKTDLAERHIRDEIPTRPGTKHSTSLPLPGSSPRVFGAPAPGSKAPAFGAPAPAARGVALPSGPAPVFGAPAPAGFGRPKPARASTIDVPTETTTTQDDGDSQERIRNAFDAFGPRVGGGGGFSRPRPAGRR